jgi:competence protein ComFC
LRKSNSATRFCKCCFERIRSSSWSSLLGERDCLCEKCFSQFSPGFHRFSVKGVNAHYLYFYDDQIRSRLYQLKGCFDVELAEIFIVKQAPILKRRYKGFTMICAPSSQEKDRQRGFNHVQEVFRSLNLPVVKAILKTKDIKQADLNYSQRQKIGEALRWRDGVSIVGKKILLVDDVYTTGATIKACLALIKKHHPLTVQILVMSKTRKAS